MIKRMISLYFWYWQHSVLCRTCLWIHWKCSLGKKFWILVGASSSTGPNTSILIKSNCQVIHCKLHQAHYLHLSFSGLPLQEIYHMIWRFFLAQIASYNTIQTSLYWIRWYFIPAAPTALFDNFSQSIWILMITINWVSLKSFRDLLIWSWLEHRLLTKEIGSNKQDLDINLACFFSLFSPGRHHALKQT